MNFEELGIRPELVRILAGRNIRETSEIQTLVIPKLLEFSGSANEAKNILFTSPTGTGKTFAYLLPLLQELFCGNPPDAQTETRREQWPRLVILAPTYELCSQIKKEADFLCGAFLPPEKAAVHAALLIGSAALSRQIDALKKNRPVIAVGNPARILQLARMKKLSLKGMRCLVFDEGDRLCSDELFAETAELAALAPEDCRFIACSATFSAKSRGKLFSAESGRQWETITQEENDILKKNIEHWAFFAEDRKKISLLRSFIAAVKPKKALVFTAKALQVGNIVSQLQYRHYAAAGLWGGMDKKARKAALDDFRKGSVSALVSSDLAARGLDIEGISHIIALDVIDDEEAYIHRAGRTARAGKRGVMVSIGDEDEMRRLARIEKKLGITVYPKELFGGRVCAPLPAASTHLQTDGR
ncbi:DEAD/DEAH box helicase [Spirochaetia bacterium]|nr:DEAD/DEAH box helicase [Spirochaetia bacterium]